MTEDTASLAAFGLLATFTLATGAVAFCLRNLVHGVLLLAATWLGLAGFYLWVGAEFIAFAQVLIHVGAISMAALFAVLLSRRGGDPAETPAARNATFRRAILGVSTALLAALLLGGAVFASPFGEFPAAISGAGDAAAAAPSALRVIGESLVTNHAAALLATGVLLTAALLGAVLLAAADPAKEE